MDEWEKSIKDQLTKNKFKVVEVFDDGTNGANEVAHLRLADGTEIIQKVMLGVRTYHQRRKALTEVVNYLLDFHLGEGACGYVVPALFAERFQNYESYSAVWGKENVDGHKRICQVIRDYAPLWSGENWRGEIYKTLRPLGAVDNRIFNKIHTNHSAFRIALIDFITVNQDRSARNWTFDPAQDKFFAIDNGMAWYHEYPEPNWLGGCVIDDVILQVGAWRFISGVFTTALAGRELSEELLKGMKNFDSKAFFKEIGIASKRLGYPENIHEDWRFTGLFRRFLWIRDKGRFPTSEEYRKWRVSSGLMNPDKIIETGGKSVWKIEMDKDRESKKNEV